MDRIWHWVWDRYGARYSWAICAFVFALLLETFPVVAFENSSRFVEASGFHVLKGKSAAVHVFGLDQEIHARASLTS